MSNCSMQFPRMHTSVIDDIFPIFVLANQRDLGGFRLLDSTDHPTKKINSVSVLDRGIRPEITRISQVRSLESRTS